MTRPKQTLFASLSHAGTDLRWDFLSSARSLRRSTRTSFFNYGAILRVSSVAHNSQSRERREFGYAITLLHIVLYRLMSNSASRCFISDSINFYFVQLLLTLVQFFVFFCFVCVFLFADIVNRLTYEARRTMPRAQ